MVGRALLLALPVAGAIGLAGFVSCHPVEGPSGVHVSIALGASGWATTDAFDHITVIATSGAESAVVCFSPVEAFEQPRDAGATGPDPCADDLELAWTSLPTVADWHLDTRARTVNFTFASGAPVSIVAEAHVGGAAAIGSATGSVTAAIGGASVSLSLAKTGDGGAPACAVELGESLPGDAGNATACESKVAGCLCAQQVGTSLRTDAGCIGSIDAVGCDQGAATIDPTAALPACSSPDVIRGTVPSFGLGRSTCVAVGTNVRLYRCREGRDAGTCTPTADCSAPPVSVVLRRPSNGSLLQEIPLGCVPPTVFPIPIRMTANADENVIAAWIGLSAEHVDDPHTCDVELTPVMAGDCPATK